MYLMTEPKELRDGSGLGRYAVEQTCKYSLLASPRLPRLRERGGQPNASR
jgi:hypothetical protein